MLPAPQVELKQQVARGEGCGQPALHHRPDHQHPRTDSMRLVDLIDVEHQIRLKAGREGISCVTPSRLAPAPRQPGEEGAYRSADASDDAAHCDRLLPAAEARTDVDDDGLGREQGVQRDHQQRRVAERPDDPREASAEVCP